MPTDLLSELGIDSNAPDVAAAIEDAEVLTDLVASLVKLRNNLGLRQADIADRLGIVQSAVSDFERLGGDPRLSTIQRYARALGTCVEVGLRGYHFVDGGWTPVSDTPVSAVWTAREELSEHHLTVGFSLAA